MKPEEAEALFYRPCPDVVWNVLMTEEEEEEEEECQLCLPPLYSALPLSWLIWVSGDD